jgi:hypothetical protein
MCRSSSARRHTEKPILIYRIDRFGFVHDLWSRKIIATKARQADDDAGNGKFATWA